MITLSMTDSFGNRFSADYLIELIKTNIKDNQFITEEFMNSIEKSINLNVETFNNVFEFIIKYNNNLFISMTQNNSDLAHKNVQFDDFVIRMKNSIFQEILNREKELKYFCENYRSKKFYKLDDNFIKLYVALNIHFRDNQKIQVSIIYNTLNNCFDIFKTISREEITAFCNTLSTITLDEIEKYLLFFNLNLKKNVYLEGNNKFEILYNKLAQKTNSFSAINLLYLYYIAGTIDDIFNIYNLLYIQEKYRKKRKNPFYSDKRFETKPILENIDIVNQNIERIYMIFIADQKNMLNKEKVERKIAKRKTYIKVEDIDFYKSVLGVNSVVYSSILIWMFYQNGVYNNLALEYQEERKKLSQNKSKVVVVKSEKEIKMGIINSLEFSNRAKEVLLDSSFKLDKLNYIVSLLNRKLLDISFVNDNIDSFKNKNFFKNLKLLESVLDKVINYDNNILLLDNSILKLRMDLYVEHYKLNYKNTSVFDFLIYDRVFDMIDAFIELGYYDQIRKNSDILSIKNIDVLKRLLIASADNTIPVISFNNSFTEEILTGKGFLDDERVLTSQELDMFASELITDDRMFGTEINASRILIDNKISIFNSLEKYLSKDGLTYNINEVILSAPRIKRNITSLMSVNPNMDSTDLIITAFLYNSKPLSNDEIEGIKRALNIKIYS